MILIDAGNYVFKHGFHFRVRFQPYYSRGRQSFLQAKRVGRDGKCASSIFHLVLHVSGAIDYLSGVFDMPVSKDVVEREIVDQDQQSSGSLGEDRLHMDKGAERHLKQECKQRTDEGGHLEAQAALNPGAMGSGKCIEGKAVIRNKVCHDREFSRDKVAEKIAQ